MVVSRPPRPLFGSAPAGVPVDWLKSIAIVAVIAAHSGRFGFDPLSNIDRLVRVTLMAFHVPVFLLVSGYLHATSTPVTAAQVWKRWRSILGPYVFASLAMLSTAAERTWPLTTWPYVLLTGAALGIYYYVPVWLFCVLTGAVWSRLSSAGLTVALVVVVSATIARSFVNAPIGFVWAIRDPFLQGWLLCYVLGWCTRRFGWDRWIVANRWSAGLALVCCIPWIALGGTASLTRIPYGAGVAWLITAVVTRPSPRPIRWLGRETLSIYLWHLPIVNALTAATLGWPDLLRIPIQTMVTMALTIAAIALARKGLNLIGRPRNLLGSPNERRTTNAASRVKEMAA